MILLQLSQKYSSQWTGVNFRHYFTHFRWLVFKLRVYLFKLLAIRFLVLEILLCLWCHSFFIFFNVFLFLFFHLIFILTFFLTNFLLYFFTSLSFTFWNSSFKKLPHCLWISKTTNIVSIFICS